MVGQHDKHQRICNNAHCIRVRETVQDSQIYVSSAPQWTFQVCLGKLKMTTVVYEMVISAFTLLCTEKNM